MVFKEKDGWIYLGDEEERYVLGQPGIRNMLVFGVNPSTAAPGKDAGQRPRAPETRPKTSEGEAASKGQGIHSKEAEAVSGRAGFSTRSTNCRA